MKKIAIVLFILFSIPLFSQSNDFAKVYLKDGTIWIGKIIAENDTAVRTEIEGGSILLLKKSEIKQIERGPRRKIVPKRYGKEMLIRQKGVVFGAAFGGYPGAGYYYGGLINSGFNAIHLKSSYKFNRFAQAGMTVGLLFPRTGNSNLLAWRGRMESEFLERAVSPYLYGEAGYSISFNTRENANYYEKGGFGMGAGAGLRIYTRRMLNYFFEMGYWRQNLEEHFDYRPWGSIETRYYRLNRFAFSLGLEF